MSAAVDPLEEAAYRVLSPADGPGETARVVNLNVAQHIRDEAVQQAFNDGAAHAITHISEALGDEDDIAEIMAGDYEPVEVQP